MSSSGSVLARVQPSRSLPREAPALLLIFALALWLWAASPAFRSAGNLLALARESSVIGIMACGEAVVLIVGGIDLSVASLLVLATGAAALAMAAGWPLPLAVALGFAVGGLAGLLNGLLITRLRLPPIVVTLAAYGIYRAIITLLTHSQEIGPLPSAFTPIGFGLYPLGLLMVVAGTFSIFMAKTRLGRNLYALGGSEEACRVSGLPISRLRPLAYVISGLTATLAGLVFAASSGALQSKAASGYELDVIAACIVGGVSIRGGQGSMAGAVAGAVLLRLLNDALLLLNVPVDWYRMVIAGALLLAALGDRLVRQRAGASA